MHHAEFYRAIVDFIARVGIPIEEGALAGNTFLPGIALRRGGIVVDPQRLEWPGDLLHEAGHLAVLPGVLRAGAGDEHGDLQEAEHGGELEAMAWAYAAVVELALPPDVLLHPGGYRGRSQELLQMYAFGVYPGLGGLCANGMASAPGFGGAPVDERHYPRMRTWLRA